MTSLDADVVVVGAGVSGSFAALESAMRSLNVILCEEHPQVGEPSHCSGHVGIQTMRQLGVDPPSEIIENEIRGATIYSPNGTRLELERDEPVTWVLNRAAFDRYLADQASKHGAKLLTSARAEAPLIENGRVSGVRLREGRSIRARIVIDAEGASPLLPRLLGLRLPPPEHSMIVNSAQGYMDEVQDVEPDKVEVYFGRKFAPGFFAWIIPRRDGSAKVGLAAWRANPKVCLERFVREHHLASSKLSGAALTSVNYHPIPIGRPADRSYGDGFLLVGDAASQVKATTGGGIVFGMICGRFAAETAAEAIRLDKTTANFLRMYERRWRSAVGFDLMAMSALRQLLLQLPDYRMDQMVATAKRLGADKVLNATNDIDYQGRNLARLSTDPRLFLTILYAAALSIPFILRRPR